MIEFKPWDKIARLNRDIIVTEKIDGTNGVIYIGEDGEFLVGSRTRWITPDKDNFGFAAWAHTNKEDLMKLGAGFHYGEWWGKGIQRGYGIDDRRFSLFNVERWRDVNVRPSCCGIVPTLYVGAFSEAEIKNCLDMLRNNGSRAADFNDPEGIVIFHTGLNGSFKVTLKNDEKPKGQI